LNRGVSPLLWATAAGAAIAVRTVGATMRLGVVGEHRVAGFWAAGRPLIYAMWHSQVLMSPLLHERLRRTRGARVVHVMASRSRDGDLLARFVGHFGFAAVRGSSSRGGATALRGLIRCVRSGHDVVVAPDGPRGPRERVQPGIVALASHTGAPLVPAAFVARPVRRLQSWDRFEVPLPFGRGTLAFGPPIHVGEGDDRQLVGKNLEMALAEVTSEAGRALAEVGPAVRWSQ
jgi:lysophospholipid acyltransferase (LPLAT)-like uncharacterized protein